MYPKINIFNNFPFILRRKTSNAIIVWILFLIISFLLFLIIAFNYEFNLYDDYLGYVKDDGIVIYLEEENMSFLNSSLVFNNTSYNFEIISISEDYYISNNKNYREVVISFDLNEKYKIENNILNLSFKHKKTTIFKEIKKGIKIWKN